MRLKEIRESLHGQKLLHRSQQQIQNQTYNGSSGHDSGARSTGYSHLISSVPKNPRHRRFLGFETRMGIRL